MAASRLDRLRDWVCECDCSYVRSSDACIHCVHVRVGGFVLDGYHQQPSVRGGQLFCEYPGDQVSTCGYGMLADSSLLSLSRSFNKDKLVPLVMFSNVAFGLFGGSEL